MKEDTKEGAEEESGEAAAAVGADEEPNSTAVSLTCMLQQSKARVPKCIAWTCMLCHASAANVSSDMLRSLLLKTHCVLVKLCISSLPSCLHRHLCIGIYGAAL